MGPMSRKRHWRKCTWSEKTPLSGLCTAICRYTAVQTFSSIFKHFQVFSSIFKYFQVFSGRLKLLQASSSWHRMDTLFIRLTASWIALIPSLFRTNTLLAERLSFCCIDGQDNRSRYLAIITLRCGSGSAKIHPSSMTILWFSFFRWFWRRVLSFWMALFSLSQSSCTRKIAWSG